MRRKELREETHKQGDEAKKRVKLPPIIRLTQGCISHSKTDETWTEELTVIPPDDVKTRLYVPFIDKEKRFKKISGPIADRAEVSIRRNGLVLCRLTPSTEVDSVQQPGLVLP